MKEFQVSVIIPVYNAEKFLRKAFESAVHLEEVGEVILVEDASPDNALMICQELEKEYAKVKLFRHPDGKNRGAGASRNLGIEKATCEFIAFLDADDWYLPNRFKEAKKILKNPNIDGVYEPMGTWFYEDVGLLFGKKMSKEEGDAIITFLRKPVQPEDLFYSLLSKANGSFHTNGISLRKSLIEKVGLFSSKLKLHQDTEYWIRCAFYGKLISPPNPKIVAIRGVHDENRINGVNFQSKANFYRVLFEGLKKKNLNWEARLLLYKKYILFNPERKFHGAKTWRKYPELLKITLKTLFK